MQLVSVDGARLTLKNQSVNKPQLAESIRTARAKLRLTRKAFAERAGITTNTLRALENGTHARTPDVTTLQKIAQALELTVEQLLGGDTRPPHASDGLHKEDWRIARAYHDSIAEVKTATKRLLLAPRPEEELEPLALLLQTLLDLPLAVVDDVATLVTIALTDASTLALLRDWMREKTQPTPQAPVPKRGIKRRAE